MDQNKKAQHEMASWVSVITRYQKKRMVYESLGRFFWGGEEASFWASENYTRRVHFESHSPEWQVLSKLRFQHYNPSANTSTQSQDLHYIDMYLTEEHDCGFMYSLEAQMHSITASSQAKR